MDAALVPDNVYEERLQPPSILGAVLASSRFPLLQHRSHGSHLFLRR